MTIKKFQKWVTDNEGVILSDGTLNLQHLLPKAYDLLLEFELNEKLRNDILSVFVLENGEDFEEGMSLFNEQYYGLAHVHEQKQIEANEIWNEDVFNYFSEISPDGYYFGSTEGDGACIGFFKDEEQFRECLNCSHEQLLRDDNMFNDENGDFTVCDECDGSFDI